LAWVINSSNGFTAANILVTIKHVTAVMNDQSS